MQGTVEMEKARMLSGYALWLEDDLEELGRQQRQATKVIHDLSKKARFAQAFLRGTSLAAYTQCVDAFKHFEQMIPLDHRRALYDPLFVAEGSIQASDFFPNGRPSEDGQIPPARAIKNALSLISWAFDQRYIARDGSTAQEHFLALFDAIGSVAQKGLDAIRIRMKEVRENVYRAWDPVEVIGVLTNSAQQNALKRERPKE
jgi:hypothetical protein